MRARCSEAILTVTPINHTESSSQRGRTWTRFLDLETEPGEYSYPAIIQGSVGDLHMTYTWRRERVRYVRVPLAKVP
jgi:predicted neuraminidase